MANDARPRPPVSRATRETLSRVEVGSTGTLLRILRVLVAFEVVFHGLLLLGAHSFSETLFFVFACVYLAELSGKLAFGRPLVFAGLFAGRELFELRVMIIGSASTEHHFLMRFFLVLVLVKSVTLLVNLLYVYEIRNGQGDTESLRKAIIRQQEDMGLRGGGVPMGVPPAAKQAIAVPPPEAPSEVPVEQKKAS